MILWKTEWMICRKSARNGGDSPLFARHKHLYLHFKKRPPEVYQNFSELSIGDIGMSMTDMVRQTRPHIKKAD